MTYPPAKGCSPAEIRSLQNQLGVVLPAAYVEFLLWMGKDVAGCLKGTDVFIHQVLDNTEQLPLLLRENSVEWRLGEHPVCFYSHQGYQVAWFEVTASDDPLVFFYDECEDDGIVERGTLSTFLLALLRACDTWLKA